MHELGLAQDVFFKIKSEGETKGISKVKYAKVRIGETLITDREEFEELFAQVSGGAIQLEIEISALSGFCIDCKRNFSTPSFNCPFCQSLRIDIASGREIEVLEIRR